MKILVISAQQTHPVTAGNVNWIQTQCMVLKKLGHEVFFLHVQQPDFHPVVMEWIEETKTFWSNHFFSYKMTRLDKCLIGYKDKLRGQKKGRLFWGCDDKYPNGLSYYVKGLQKEFEFDACIVQYFFFTKVFEKVHFPKRAVSTHDCFSYRNTRLKDPNSIAVSVADEAKCLQRCNYVFALQDEEKFFFERIAPWSKVLNVYNYYEYKPSEIVGNKNIVVLSSGNPYNINGIKWFIDNVLPILNATHPEAKLLIGGALCSSLAKYKNLANVELLGFVKDPIEVYSKGDIAINPVFEGTGLKIKTFESIQYDKVTLVHPHSLTGIFSPLDHPLFVSDDAEEWAAYIDKVWSSRDEVLRVKTMNKEYLERMNSFVLSQYSIFAE